MAVIFTMKNTRAIDGMCQFNMYRRTAVNPALRLGIETPCSVCIIPREPEEEETGTGSPIGCCCCDSSGLAEPMTQEQCEALSTGEAQPGCSSGSFTWIPGDCSECP